MIAKAAVYFIGSMGLMIGGAPLTNTAAYWSLYAASYVLAIMSLAEFVQSHFDSKPTQTKKIK